MRDPTLRERGWFAGLLDSKGRITVSRDEDTFRLLVIIPGSKAVRDQCQDIFGGRQEGPRWLLEGRDAKAMLCCVQASLVAKREHAAAALLFPAGRPSPKALAVQEVCYRTLRRLNGA